MTKADLCFIIGNIFAAQGLRNKPNFIFVMSSFYFILYLIIYGTEIILK